jgi:hypothetical protein
LADRKRGRRLPRHIYRVSKGKGLAHGQRAAAAAYICLGMLPTES